jgi:hypothetical protein
MVSIPLHTCAFCNHAGSVNCTVIVDSSRHAPRAQGFSESGTAPVGTAMTLSNFCHVWSPLVWRTLLRPICCRLSRAV